MRPRGESTDPLRRTAKLGNAGKVRFCAPEDLPLRAIGDHSPCACASMVADFGLSAAAAPAALRRVAGSGGAALNAAGAFPCTRVASAAWRGWGPAGRPPLAACGYLRPFQSTWPTPQREGARRCAPPAGRSAHRAGGSPSGLRARTRASKCLAELSRP